MNTSPASRTMFSDDVTLPSENFLSNVFLAKYTSDGDHVWVRAAGGPGTRSGNDISIVPNPSDGRFVIHAPAQAGERIRVRVSTILGEVIHDEMQPAAASRSACRVEPTAPAPGVYVVTVQTESIHATRLAWIE